MGCIIDICKASNTNGYEIVEIYEYQDIVECAICRKTMCNTAKVYPGIHKCRHCYLNKTKKKNKYILAF
jgi:hypothetical protein